MESYGKIRLARERHDSIKEVQSAQEAGLNPRGQGGPVYNEMIELFETLGIDSTTNESDKFRQQIESWLTEKSLRIYNEYLVNQKRSPKHQEFEVELRKKFLFGFKLYLKAYLRLDMKNAPEPHASYKTTNRVHVVDQDSSEDYQRRFIAEGAAVSLAKNPTDHNFDRDIDFEGYADTYQQIDESDPSKSALAAYMFEKFRLYSKDFYTALSDSLQAGVVLDEAIDMATYSYGTDTSLYSEMAPYGMTPHEVAKYSIGNRTGVRYGFNAYKEYGHELENNYPYRDQDNNKHR